MASPHYFVSDVWPRYLDHNSCEQSGCHAASDGHGYFRLQPGTNLPLFDAPIDGWPDNWRANYFASIQLVRCDAPLSSRLFTTPAQLADDHPVGISVDNLAESKLLFQTWVDTP